MTKLVFTILDGFGYRKDSHGNAIVKASTPTFDYLIKNYPHTLLDASGIEVGLPEGQMGNSEVGHLNIGAGRIVYQPLEKINKSIKDKEFFKNEEILNVINHVKENDSSLHILGLLSDGGVHSHIEHLFALIDMCKKENLKKVYYHVFLDGRDTLPDIKEKFLKQLDNKILETKTGTIATISGRYYAMDRDNRWERVKLAYDAIVNAEGKYYNNYKELVNDTKKGNITDEFVIPSVLNKEGTIKNNDGLIVFNFRPDRIRELFKAITNNEFKEFSTKKLNNIKLVTMMSVSDEVISTPAFKQETLENTFGEYISKQNLTQLRIAETEKYAHVTYFFDGGVEKDLNGCTRKLISSPKVATYDLKPEMSATEVTDELLNTIENYDVIILNFANCDMVGHTGDFDATVKAVETVDKNLGKIYEKVKELDSTLIVTADHGNCEIMLDDNNQVITSHTTSKVPFIITKKGMKLKEGKLGDIAPTMLELLKLEKPREMTGNSLIEK
ncbi:MAG: 2,3-bisphosphoglycerate-independent phosphoglycerate mutase [Bacilli bacterium]|nr:2,3-bisphosphoglycerate-independent phosphoglycerate mutase [Bacilli bacterium]